MTEARLLIDTLRIASPGDPGVLANRWASADVEGLLQLAEHEGAILWLHRRLKMLGITLEAPMHERLTAAARLAAAKLLRLDDETAKVLGLLAAAGIVAVPLKGAALRRLSSRVSYIDARTPVDIDLLCRGLEASRAYELLCGEGYAPKPAFGAGGHHLPALYGANGIGIELHTTTMTQVPPDEAWRRATMDGVTIRFDGRSIPIPGDTELLWHAMTHALVVTELEARLGGRLRFWLDAAALLASDAVTIDWNRLRARLDEPGCLQPELARAWFVTASELAGRPLVRGALGNRPVQPLNLERLLSWRLALLSQRSSASRWPEKLFEEGARGEFNLPILRPHPDTPRLARARHMIASSLARFWWSVRAV